MELYHLTSQESVGSILSQGLIPKTGKNSSFVNERSDGVYLCLEQDVPYWQIMLGRDYLFTVDVSGLPLNCRCYAKYNEFIVDERITPDRIRLQGKLSKPRKRFMEALCFDQLLIISEACEKAARYYDKDPEVTYQDVETYLQDSDFMKENLDFGSISPETLTDYVLKVKQTRNSCFTDTYKDKKLRLWEMLPLYPKDDLAPLRIKVYRYIRNTLENINHIDTGSWSK